MQSKSKEIKAVKRCIVKRAIKNTIQVGLVVALMQAEEDVRYVMKRWINDEV